MWKNRVEEGEETHVFELLLQSRDHVLLNNDALLVKIFDDILVAFAIDADNDGLDGGVALDQDSWRGCVRCWGLCRMATRFGSLPLMARGIAAWLRWGKDGTGLVLRVRPVLASSSAG